MGISRRGVVWARGVLVSALVPLAGVATLTGPVGVAQGQMSSAAQARRALDELTMERDRLAARIVMLESELASARQEIDRLKAALSAATQATTTITAANPAAPANDPAGAAAIPADEYAAPASLLRALRVRYEEGLRLDRSGKPIAEPVTADAVQEWADDVNRDMRDRRQWLTRVRVLAAETSEFADRGGTAEVLEPATLRVIGDPFPVMVPAKYVRRIEREGPAALWRLDIFLRPAVTVNPDRAEPGPFPKPDLIGPYAEFGFELTWLNLTPTTAEEAKARATAPGSDAVPGTTTPATPVDR